MAVGRKFLCATSASGGQLKYCDQLFFVTAWYKKICARNNGCWQEISVRHECFIKTLLESFLVVCLLSAAREIFKKA